MTGILDAPPDMRVIDETGARPEQAWQPPSVTSLGPAPDRPVLRLHAALPTAAFSRRDALLPGYPAAVAAARSFGYEPVLRTVGGRMAPLHEDTLIIDLTAPRPEPQAGTRERFALVAEAITAGLRRLGVPAQVGQVAGEYCPGEFSVNAAGRLKLAGIAQRVTRWGFLVSTVLVLDRPEPLAEVVGACYGELGLPVDPAVTGAVRTYAAGVSRSEIAAELITELARRGARLTSPG